MLAINDHYHAWFYMAVILTLTVLNTLIHLFKVLPTSCTTPWLWTCFVAHNCECYFSRRVSIRERKDIETIWHMLSIFIIHPNRHKIWACWLLIGLCIINLYDVYAIFPANHWQYEIEKKFDLRWIFYTWKTYFWRN